MNARYIIERLLAAPAAPAPTKTPTTKPDVDDPPARPDEDPGTGDDPWQDPGVSPGSEPGPKAKRRKAADLFKHNTIRSNPRFSR